MEQKVTITLEEGIALEGILGQPDRPSGIVLFAHGSGSSRLSPRNNYVARVLQEGGIATLLFDLLTTAEDRVYAQRFDINLLTRRLVSTTYWVNAHPQLGNLCLGYFGSSTGAAAALQAASEVGGNVISAVVSRGGRPDLAIAYLDKVAAPTLLIVGELDKQVLRLNRQALEYLNVEKQLAVVPGATHLFEEPGTLEQAAGLAKEWFLHHLR